MVSVGPSWAEIAVIAVGFIVLFGVFAVNWRVGVALVVLIALGAGFLIFIPAERRESKHMVIVIDENTEETDGGPTVTNEKIEYAEEEMPVEKPQSATKDKQE